VSPQRQRLGLYCLFYTDNIRQEEVCLFLRELLRHVRGEVIVVWDNGPIHKGPIIDAFCAEFPRLHLEPFPPYAPELNPDEGVWSYLKGKLANSRPDDIEELQDYLEDEIRTMSGKVAILRGCILGSDLPFF
jgi:putative transposase